MPPESPNPPETKPKSKREEPNPWGLAGAGLELGGVVAVLSLGGWWLDKRWGTSPAFLLTGLAIGMIGGLYNLYRQGKRYF